MITQHNDLTDTINDLIPLVAENYKMRAEHKLPDVWFWADILMLELGANANHYEKINKSIGY